MTEIALRRDGKELGQAYLAAPNAVEGGPAVLVLHAWWGLTPFFKTLCDRLAAEGFVALAPDLHGGKTASTIPEAEALMQQRDLERTQATAVASVQALRSHPLNTRGRIGVIGFSMGAAWAISLASELTPEDIRASVLFYGVGEGDFNRCQADFIGHFAEHDEWEPDEYVRHTEAALRTAGRDVTFYFYPNVGHWFFEDDKPDDYNPEAARLAWRRTLQFLREKLT